MNSPMYATFLPRALSLNSLEAAYPSPNKSFIIKFAWHGLIMPCLRMFF